MPRYEYHCKTCGSYTERFALPMAVMPLLETEINELPIVEGAARSLLGAKTIAYAEEPQA